MHHNQHCRHGDNPLVGSCLEGQEHVVTHTSAKSPEAKDGDAEVTQACKGNAPAAAEAAAAEAALHD
jgi:hypothetical protein